MCECSICYEAIEAAKTGCVEMSCSHKFHMLCISGWFLTQKAATCPMCRKEAGPLERVAEVEQPVEPDTIDTEIGQLARADAATPAAPVLVPGSQRIHGRFTRVDNLTSWTDRPIGWRIPRR